jgi:hypothetical protein
MSEVNALKTLRETTLAHLAQSDYEKILKAVEVGGIDSLTGTAAMVVKSAVLKHGAHDQSSHNPKKGGGGAGRGGGSAAAGSSGKPTTLGDTHKQELASQERAIRGAANSAAARGGGTKDPYIGPPTKAAVSAADSIGKARSAKTIEEASSHIEDAKSKLGQATEQFENENFHDVARVTFTTSVNLDSIMSAARRGVPITERMNTGAADVRGPAFPMGTYGESFGD